MRNIVLIALLGFSLAACVSRTVVEHTPAQPSTTVVVPQGSTVCAPGTVC